MVFAAFVYRIPLVAAQSASEKGYSQATKLAPSFFANYMQYDFANAKVTLLVFCWFASSSDPF